MSSAAASTSSKYKVWETVRAEARRLDGELESKIAGLEALGRQQHTTAINVSSSHSSASAAAAAATGISDSATLSRFDRDVRDASASLERLAHLVGQMSELSAQIREEGIDSSIDVVLGHTARLEECVLDKRQALTRLSSEVHKKYERAQLLTKVQHEIAEFDERADMRYATKEQDSLRRTIDGVEAVLSTQGHAGAKLSAQREMFEKIGGKVVSVADQIPFIRDVIKRIDAKRRRESVLLSLLIGTLMFVCFLFW